MLKRTLLTALLVLSLLTPYASAQKPTREEKVRADKAKVESAGFWIYNDLPRAYALAKETDLFTHVNALRRIGEQVSVRLLRGDKSLVLQLPIQK